MEQVRHLDVGQPDIQQASFVAGTLSLPRETLATQIARSVLESVRDGKLAVGTQLPSEAKLAEMYSVSRNTLREAIRLLIAQGVVESRKGVGTFVQSIGFSSWPVETGIEELSSTTHIIAAAGHEPGCRSYRLDVIHGPAVVTGALLLDAGSQVYRLFRVRLADDEPVIVCVDYLAIDLVPAALIHQFDSRGSLFAFLEDAAGLSISVARAVLKPVLPDAEVTSALGVASGEPLLLLRQTHFDGQNRPFLFSENYVNSSLFEYHVRRMPAAFFAAHPSLHSARVEDAP
ncbi:MAG: GntR family transcriptional regulator [Chloroflexota bacterium]